MPLAEVYSYGLPDGSTIEKVMQKSGDPLWAVRRNVRCLNKQCEWEYEPQPSSRDESFFSRCRFVSPELAYDTWSMTERIVD